MQFPANKCWLDTIAWKLEAPMPTMKHWFMIDVAAFILKFLYMCKWHCNNRFPSGMGSEKYSSLVTSDFRLQSSFQRSLDMMTSPNGIIFRVTGSLWGESTCHRWIPLTKSIDKETDVFYDLYLNKRFGKQLGRRWFETPLRSLWRHFIMNHIQLGTDVFIGANTPTHIRTIAT